MSEMSSCSMYMLREKEMKRKCGLSPTNWLEWCPGPAGKADTSMCQGCDYSIEVGNQPGYGGKLITVVDEAREVKVDAGGKVMEAA